MRWLRRFGERGPRARPQGGDSATGLCATILTACGFHLRAIPLFAPAPGLELPGSAEQHAVKRGRLILLLNLPSRLGARQWRCQVVGIRRIGAGPNRSVFPDPAESFADERI
jgi:hypothetical protein